MYIIEEVFSIIYISIFNRKRSIWVDKVLIVKYIIDKYWYNIVLQYIGKGWLYRNIFVVYYYNVIRFIIIKILFLGGSISDIYFV